MTAEPDFLESLTEQMRSDSFEVADSVEGPREVGPASGFDSARYNRADTISSQLIIPAVLGHAIEGLDDKSLHHRPSRSTWSIAEYVDHVREVAFGNRMAIELALADPGVDLGDPPDVGITSEQKRVVVTDALAGAAEEYQQMQELLAGLTDAQWQTSVTLGGVRHSVGWFARHVLHEGLHHLGDIGRIRHQLGLGPQTQTGSVIGVFVSDGGVPKQSVPSAEITGRGVSGDSQTDRRHHGRPVQAICLWSAEVIEGFRADGHPIHPGAAGENLTVTGVDWAQLRPGARINAGEVPMMISAYAIPCAKNAQWFSDRNFNRMLHDRNPGKSRLYAIPLGEGTVAAGDPVTVEPADGVDPE